MRRFSEERFQGSEIGSFWDTTGTTPGAMSIVNNRLVASIAPAETVQLAQTAPVGKFDIFCKVQMPPATSLVDTGSIQLTLYDGDYDGDGDAGIMIWYGDDGGVEFHIYAWEDSDGWVEVGETYVDFGTTETVWLRIKYDPSDKPRYYYTSSKPKSDNDWTEVAVSITPNWSPTGTLTMLLALQPDSEAGKEDYYVDFIRAWPPIKNNGLFHNRGMLKN